MSRHPEPIDAPGRRLELALLGTWTLLQAFWLLPMVFVGGPELNDHVLHAALAQEAADRIAAGRDPLDFWFSQVGLGFPVSHHYQHLPHLLIALLHLATGRLLDCTRLVELVSAALLLAWPWVVHRSLRAMGIGAWPALGAALVAPLVSSTGLGIGYQSYGWFGFGLFTQLVAMVLLPPALAALRRTMLGRGGWATAVGLLALTAACHPAYGLIGAGTALLMVWSAPAGERTPALVRLLWIGAGAAAVLAYFLLPLWLDRAAVSHSVWEAAEKFDGPGHHRAWQDLLGGRWWDHARLPVLTALVACGAVLTVAGRGGRAGRWGLAMALVWAALYIGRPTWGQLLDLVPLMRSFHVHRLIGGVQLGGVLLSGMVVGRAARWLAGRAGAVRWRREALAGAAVVALLAYPAVDWSLRYRTSHEAQRTNRAAAAEWAGELEAALATVTEGAPGRVHAGQVTSWGGTYRVGHTPVHLWLTARGVDTIAFQNHSLSPAGDAMMLFEEDRRAHYLLFNVRHTLSSPEHTPPLSGAELQRSRRVRVTATPGGGWFALIRAPQVVEGRPDRLHAASRAWMADAGPETGEHLRLQLARPPRFEPQPPFPRVHSGGRRPAGRCRDDTYDRGHAAVDVTAEEDALVMLKATYHPGWRATVDGAEAETVHVTPGFVAVPVQAGQHHVELTYRAPPWRLPLALLGLALVGLIALVERRGSRAAEPPLAPLVELPAGALALAWDVLSTRRWAVRLRPALVPLGAVTVVALLAGLPLLRQALPSGHDILHYVPRLIELHRNVAAGHLLPAWAPDLAGGRGLPLFLYTPPLLVGVAELLYLAVRHPVTAVNGAALVLLVASGWATFAWSRRWAGDAGGAVAGAAVVLAPYTLVDLYVRGSLDELACFATVPLALWAVDRAVERLDLRGIAGLAVAAALLVATEVALLWVVVPPVVAYAVARAAAAPAGHRGRRAAVLGAGGGLGLGLAAWTLVPALLLGHLVHGEHAALQAQTYAQHFLDATQWFRGPWGYGYSVEGLADGMSFALGAVHLAGAAAAAWLLARGRGEPRGLVAGLLAVLALSLLLTSLPSAPLWRWCTPLQGLLFPWRFLLPATLAAAALAGLALRGLAAPLSRRSRMAVALGVIAALALLSLPHARPYRAWPLDPARWTADAIAGSNRTATWRGELQPTWAEHPPVDAVPSPATLPAADGQIQRFERTGLVEMAVVATARRPTRLVLGTYYFPGWRAWIDDRPVETLPEPGSGLLSVALPEGEHRVEVRYRPPPGLQLARVISGASLLGLIGLWIAGGRRRGPRARSPGT